MLKGIQQLGRGQRIVIFAALMIGGLLLILAITVFLILLSVNTSGRVISQALLETVMVEEFAALPGEDAYPSAIATAPDGTVYTGSYETGAVWAIDPAKPVQAITDAVAAVAADAPFIREIEGSRDQVGSVRGLTVAPDGTLYILDGVFSDPRGQGGKVWQVTPEGVLIEIGTITRELTVTNDQGQTELLVEGLLSPKDITLDANGNLYITDRGHHEIWKLVPGSTQAVVFWRPAANDDARVIPTGVEYDAATDSLIVTDSQLSTIYRIPLLTGVEEIVYRHEGNNPPGFGGLTIAPDGQLYVAALDQNGVVTVRDGELVYIVGMLRGASDVAAAADGTLYATNFDSASLVLPGVNPQLPFSIDRIRIGAVTTEG